MTAITVKYFLFYARTSSFTLFLSVIHIASLRKMSLLFIKFTVIHGGDKLRFLSVFCSELLKNKYYYFFIQKKLYLCNRRNCYGGN